MKIARFCRSCGIPIIMGGIHISSLPYCLTSDMDIGIIGEGEETMLELFQIFSKEGLNSQKLQYIKGIVYRDAEGHYRLTPQRELISPIDKIPYPARHLLDIEKGEDIHLFSSRGCPYRCVFCASSRFWDKMRFFSADYVLGEIEHVIRKYKPFRITFYDDLFIADQRRLYKIVDLITAKGINKKVEFHLNCHANLINEDLVRLLKRMNVKSASIGFESGSEKTLAFLKKGASTVEQNKRAIDLLNKYAMDVHGTFIIGAPEETREEIVETLNFIRRSNLKSASTYLLTPFPGTPIWDYAEDKGIVSKDMDWDMLSIDTSRDNAKRVVLSEKLSKKDVLLLYSIFKAEEKKKWIIGNIKRAISNPKRAIHYLLGKFQKIKKMF